MTVLLAVCAWVGVSGEAARSFQRAQACGERGVDGVVGIGAEGHRFDQGEADVEVGDFAADDFRWSPPAPSRIGDLGHEVDHPVAHGRKTDGLARVHPARRARTVPGMNDDEDELLDLADPINRVQSLRAGAEPAGCRWRFCRRRSARVLLRLGHGRASFASDTPRAPALM